MIAQLIMDDMAEEQLGATNKELCAETWSQLFLMSACVLVVRRNSARGLSRD